MHSCNANYRGYAARGDSSQREKSYPHAFNVGSWTLNVECFSLLRESGAIDTISSHLNVCVHASQFPERLAGALRESLRSRRIHPRFHYQTAEQARHWLAVHCAYAPVCVRTDGLNTYDSAYTGVANRIPASSQCHLIGLGCGGGNKEARLAERLSGNGHKIFFTPVDTSLPLALTAWAKLKPWQAAPVLAHSPQRHAPAGVVCDLEAAPDLPEILASCSPQNSVRIVTFFGMLPNLEPGQVLPLLSRLLGPQDRLLISANLNPDSDEEAGLQHLLSQYQNPETERWLTLFLSGLGVDEDAGALHWRIERAATAPFPRCFTAWYRFQRAVKIEVEGELFTFQPEEELRLFFSYRYTQHQVRVLLARHALTVLDSWSDVSGEEGVFLCGRADVGVQPGAGA